MAALKQEYQDILNKYVKHRISNSPVMYNEQSVIGIIKDVADLFEKKDDFTLVKTSPEFEEATGILFIHTNNPEIFNRPK